MVRQNQVLHTGGSTVSPDPDASGIRIAGNGAQALYNTVVDTVPALVSGPIIVGTGIAADFSSPALPKKES